MNKTSKNLEYMGKQDRRNMIRSEFVPTFAAIRTACPRGTGQSRKVILLQKKSNSCKQNCPAQAE